ncbi:hypothetical protein OG349_21820 [Streptomyces sp. NBC_01317]|uniref:hypothetical protein n=1 Tax=Streptomyces sp. NBC_01317 TaxID=2903822 RepID=UPI002E1382C5|nr:hypothetical protein OG349_21820 [Streptomyces sp. NBC_01317]
MAEVRADEDELAALIEQGGFWRITPDWVPGEFAPPTRDLVERVALGLRRSVDGGQ